MTTINMTPDITPAQTISEEARIQQEWLGDCRNPETKQTKGTLLRPSTGGACCLGVLGNGLAERHADWLQANEFKIEIKDTGPYRGMRIIDLQVNSETDALLPKRLATLLGIPSVDNPDDMDSSLTGGLVRLSAGELRDAGVDEFVVSSDAWDDQVFETSLADLNDEGASLALVANVIERILEPR